MFNSTTTTIKLSPDIKRENVCAVIRESVWAEPIRRIRGSEEMQGNAQPGTHIEREDERCKKEREIYAYVVIDQMLLYNGDGGQPYLDCDDVACLLESDFKDLTTSSTANLALADQV